MGRVKEIKYFLKGAVITRYPLMERGDKNKHVSFLIAGFSQRIRAGPSIHPVEKWVPGI